MANILVYSAGISGAAPYAEQQLEINGISLVKHPTPEITHLLLDIPSREIPDGLLDRLPENITIVGGNLNKPELEHYRKIDLLKNERYLTKNAAITAECALRVAACRINTTFLGTSVLVIGWGRIGKVLSALLKKIGCHVTVAARKPSDRAMLEVLGYRSADLIDAKPLEQYTVLFSTVPAPVYQKSELSLCPDTLKIDLASTQSLEGADVIWARGLPGIYAPAASGKLIADTLIEEVTT